MSDLRVAFVKNLNKANEDVICVHYLPALPSVGHEVAIVHIEDNIQRVYVVESVEWSLDFQYVGVIIGLKDAQTIDCPDGGRK